MDIYGQYTAQQQQMAAQPQFRVVKSLMVESGTYNQEFTRPYASNVDSDTCNIYSEQTQHGQIIDRGSLASIAGRIIAPSATPDAQVNMTNGWDTRRIIFMMEVIELNTKITTVVMGYGDRVDLSHSGIVDPNLRLTINSTVTLNTVEVSTPHGPMIRKRVVDNSHLMGIQTLNSLQPLNPDYNSDGPRIYMQRPTDVANNLSLGHMNAGIIGDGRTQIVPNKQTRSRRSNNNAPVFLSEVINGIVQTRNSPEMTGNHVSTQDVFSQAGAILGESMVHSDPTLRYITNNSNLRNEGSISWGNLCQIFPDVDDATMYYNHSQNPHKMANHFESNAGSFEYWNAVNWEAVLATTIFHTLPSLISQCMLMGIGGSMTNDTVDGQPVILIEDARSFVDGFDRTQAVQQVEYRLLTEVMPGLTMGNQRTIFVAFNINLVRDGWVSIAIDGQAPVEYSSPCFADGLLLPTLTTNQQSLASLSTNINTLVEVSNL